MTTGRLFLCTFAVAAASLVVGVPTVLGQASSPSSPLWSEYPLDPTQAKDSSPPQVGSPAGPPVSKRTPASGRTDGRGVASSRKGARGAWNSVLASPQLLALGAIAAWTLVVLLLVLGAQRLGLSPTAGPAALIGLPRRAPPAAGRSGRRAGSARGARHREENQDPRIGPSQVARARSTRERHADGASPVVRGNTERCVIEWSRGYMKSQFYARARTEDGRRYVAAMSPAFSWRRADPPPPKKGPVAAHKALVEHLRLLGWEAVGEGASWYASSFRRAPGPSLRALATVLNQRPRER
jgi:hypothetical protein